MKETMKDLIISTAISIGIAIIILCLAGIIFDIRCGGIFILDNYGFTKAIVGCVIIGFGFGAPSVVYRKESLPMPVRAIIHLGAGCIIYTLVAYAVGWIGNSASMGQGLVIAAIQLSAVFIIWLLFMCHYRKEAKMMDKMVKTMKQQRRSDS